MVVAGTGPEHLVVKESIRSSSIYPSMLEFNVRPLNCLSRFFLQYKRNPSLL